MGSSISSPFFLLSAEDLVRRLDALAVPGHDGGHPHSLEAHRLAAEARELCDIFRGWATTRPTDEVRIAGIGRLFELNRSAMDLMTKLGPPSSSGRGKSTAPPSSDPRDK